MIDTGASVHIIDEHALLRIQKYSRKTNQSPPPITLCKTNTKVYGYGAKTPLPIVGKFDVEIEPRIVVTTIIIM